jgi:hypothetical protein
MGERRGERNLPIYAWPADKQRLEEIRASMQKKLAKPVVMAEVIRTLLAEHDAALEVQTP